MTKRGQLTIFIIIGILLLLLIGLVLYFTRERAITPLEETRVGVIKVPVELQPVQDFVQTCMYSVAKDGLNILGARGGYLAPRQSFNPAEPTAAAAVQFAPDSELKIPYWWHMNARNDCVGDCTFASERPSLQSIEQQLNSYLIQELPKCFGTFEQFRQQQLIVMPAGALQPDTKITKGNVVVRLNYLLDITKSGQTSELQEFVTELPVKFYDIYMLATNITNLESQHAFLERLTRALIDAFGHVDEEAIPPVSEMEFGFGTGTTWIKFDVKEKIQQMLASYIPLLKVTFTHNYRYLRPSAGQNRQLYNALYNRGFTVPVIKPNVNTDVRFSYLPWWNPYFNLNCNGQLCQPEGISSTLGFLFGVRRYTFAYDLSYPVLVDIKDTSAFGGEGYRFAILLEANMRNNEPLALLEPVLSVPTIETSTLLCDPLVRTGGNLTLNVRTSAGTPVDEAQILYRCGTETCFIGESDNGRLVAPLPRCLGGMLVAQHETYASAIKPFSVLDDSQKTADLIMAAPYPVDFAVKRWLLKKQGGNWELDTSTTENQDPRATSIILLERKSSQYADSLMVFGEVCGSPASKAPIPCGTPPEDTSQDVKVYPGDYHVTIHTMLHPSPDLVIPPDHRCVSYRSSSGRKKKKCYWVPEKPIIFNQKKPLFAGYAEFDWSVTDEELKGAKTIEFSYINFALDRVQPPSNRKIEDLEVMGNLFTYSQQHENLLVPRIYR